MTLNLIRPETQTSENSEPLILFLTMMCLDLTLIAKTTKAKMKQTKHLKIRGTICGHVWMWELGCEEGWVLKNWWFWTVVLEKTLESPLDCKEIQPVHSEDQPWDFFGRNDAKAETPVLWPSHGKSWLIGKDSDAGRDWGQEEKGTTEDEMAGWHHWLDRRESGWTPGIGDGQGGLACCDSWGRKESDTTERLIWSDLIWYMCVYIYIYMEVIVTSLIASYVLLLSS